MDKKDIKESMWGQLKSIWNSLPEAIKLLGTILSIAIAIKALFPAAIVEINDFNAAPEIIEPGESAVLNWGVSGADNITIEPGIGTVSSNGSLSVSPPETTTYKLIASGNGKEKVSLCTVTVKENPLLISSFDASPDSIKSGESAVLNWHVTGAPNVTIEPGIGVVEPGGTLNVSPANTTTYKLTASNGDKEDAAYCTVAVEENSASPDNTSPSELPSTEESLAQENPGNQEDPETQESSAPQENQASQESLPSIGSFNANPDIIGEGKSSDLTWSVSTASKVTIEPGIGTVGLTGSQRVFPEETTTYTLTATNEFGSVDATKVIFVQEPSAHASQEPISTPSPAPISTPEQLSPADGTEFDSSASEIVLEWKAVQGAASYTVEIDEYDSGSGLWLSESGKSRIKSDISATSYSFEPPAKTSGRWRIWAVSSDGQESEKSDWWSFSYRTEASQNETQLNV